MTDSLAKKFHIHLSASVGNNKDVARVLRANGWLTFVDQDRPETTDPVEMACSALLYIGFDNRDNWCNSPEVMTAVIAFLEETLESPPTLPQLQERFPELGELLYQNPVDKKSVKQWFDSVYRQ